MPFSGADDHNTSSGELKPILYGWLSAMSVHSLQQQGKDAYRQANYAQALDFFDRALSQLPTVELYDKCAACHCRLNDLPAALKDAKKAIQLGRGDPTGYIRAGHILAKMGKPETAMEIYAYGLKSVQHTGSGFKALTERHGELLAQLAPPKSIDPLTVLPRELAVYMLGFLSFRQVVAVLRVSKQWRDFIQSEPVFWVHLDLTHARTKVKSSFISRCINIARRKLSAVTIRRLYDFDKSLQALSKFCAVDRLILLEAPLDSADTVSILKSFAGLRELRIEVRGGSPQIAAHSLLLHYQETLEVYDVPFTLDARVITELRAPKLRELRMHLGGFLHELDNPYERLVQRSPVLESLCISEIAYGPAVSMTAPVVLKSAQHLTRLEFETFRSHRSSLDLPPSLRVLKLSVLHGSAPNFFIEGHGNTATPKLYLPNLEDAEIRIGGAPLKTTLDALGLRETGLAEDRAEITQGETHGSAQFPRQLSKLKRLAIHEALLDDSLSDWSRSRLDHLECLAVTRPVWNRADDFLNRSQLHFAAELPCLHTLDLSHTRVTGVGIKKVVNAGSVKELVLNGCTEMGKDVVQWARARGIRVEYSVSHGSTMTAGRRVRY